MEEFWSQTVYRAPHAVGARVKHRDIEAAFVSTTLVPSTTDAENLVESSTPVEIASTRSRERLRTILHVDSKSNEANSSPTRKKNPGKIL